MLGRILPTTSIRPPDVRKLESKNSRRCVIIGGIVTARGRSRVQRNILLPFEGVASNSFPIGCLAQVSGEQHGQWRLISGSQFRGELSYALCTTSLLKDGVGRAIAFAPNSCEGDAKHADNNEEPRSGDAGPRLCWQARACSAARPRPTRPQLRRRIRQNARPVMGRMARAKKQ